MENLIFTKELITGCCICCSAEAVWFCGLADEARKYSGYKTGVDCWHTDVVTGKSLDSGVFVPLSHPTGWSGSSNRDFCQKQFFSWLDKRKTAEKKNEEKLITTLITIFSQVRSAWCDQPPPCKGERQDSYSDTKWVTDNFTIVLPRATPTTSTKYKMVLHLQCGSFARDFVFQSFV